MIVTESADSKERSNSPRLSLTDDELLRSDPVLRRLLRLVWFDSAIFPRIESKVAVYLPALIVVPFILLGGAAILENRFFLGSLFELDILIDQKEEQVIGMSFLGDTMVWPFFFLIPMALLLLGHAIRSVRRLSEKLLATIDLASDEETRTSYRKLLDDARSRSDAKRGGWKLLKNLGLAVGLSFWIYNAITCTFRDGDVLGRFSLPIDDPYSSRVVYIIRDGERIEVTSADPISIRKWDTEREMGGKLSWIMARIWTFFAYVLIPVIVAKVLNLIGVLRLFSSWLMSIGGNLTFDPLAPQGRGGFSALSGAALALAYTSIPVSLMAAASLFKEATPASFHNIIQILIMIPIVLVLFTVPMYDASRAIGAAKQRYLERLSNHFSDLSAKLIEKVGDGKLGKSQLDDLQFTLESLRKLYDQASKAHVWKIDTNVIWRLTGTLLVPVGMAFIKHWLK